MSSPRLPFVPVTASKDSSLSDLVQYNLKDAFDDFGIYQAVGWTDEMVEVFKAVQVYGRRLAGRWHMSSTPLDTYTTDQRNFIQYFILSLPPRRSDPNDSRCALYECCRVALQIFSVGTIFPVLDTADRPVTEELVKDFYAMLVTYYPTLTVVKDSDPLVLRLLRWAITVFGIAAYDTPYQNQSVDMLRAALVQEPDISFLDFKKANLEPVLWIDMTCDSGARAFWGRAFGPAENA